jgi:hypothetical protein
MTELIVGGGLFLGCAMRALLPFFRKQAQAAEKNQSVKWEKRYIYTIIFAFIGAFIETMIIIPTFQIPSTYIFPMAFVQGWGTQDIINSFVK